MKTKFNSTMKTTIFTIRLLLVMILLIDSFLLPAQTNAKQFYKQGIKDKNAKKFTSAIDNLSKAIELNNTEVDYFKERAEVYDSINNFEKAVADYEKIILMEKNADNNFKTGQYYFKLSRYQDASKMFYETNIINKKFVPAYQQNAISKIYLKDFAGAINDCDKAINYESGSFISYYYKAIALDSSGEYLAAVNNYEKAINLAKSIKKQEEKPDFKVYYSEFATAQRNSGLFDESLKNYNTALSYDNSDADIYFLRGIAYFKKSDFKSALEDYNKSIFINNKNPKVFYERAMVNKQLSNFQSAIDDLSKLLLFDANVIEGYSLRGNCYEEMGKYTEAIKDYEKSLSINPKITEVKNFLASAKQKLYEKNREAIPPIITLILPDANDKKEIQIPDNKMNFTIKGRIKDDSHIKIILVNSIPANFDKESLNPDFLAEIPVQSIEKITIKVSDVYSNTDSISFSIIRTETVPPIITLKTPFATSDYVIDLHDEQSQIYVEGEIKDESTIQSIVVEGVAASYELNKINPVFSAKINISEKDTISIIAVDKFGNSIINRYSINRQNGSVDKGGNPMGRTYVVFVQNSNYENMQSLDGPANDITLMKSALANYKIDKIIHNENMTKKNLDKFFSIELRDIVKANGVTSVLIWFAGHGKYINETGYWIPVDGNKDDESTLFSVIALKAYMKSYSNVLHSLVISDACESGPAFYLAMRDIPTDKKCDNWNNTKFRSAQVLTSSSVESSSDVSIFTQTFARTLSSNPESCIPIEKIAVKVTDAVKQNQKQTPRFGKIQDLTDENGTFFFIKK